MNQKNMKSIGKLTHERCSPSGEVFVFYGYNPANGEPHLPFEFTVHPNSPDIPFLMAQCGREDIEFSIRPRGVEN